MIQFTVPDFYEKGQFNLDWIAFMNTYPQKFEECRVSSVYGSFPLMIWAGGRQNKVDNINFIGFEDVKRIFMMFNRNGIGVVLTCTNSLLQKEHLGDFYCNSVIEILSGSSLNAVLVNSPVLEVYLRNKYPELKIHRSTTTCSKALVEDRYDKIVVDFTLNNSLQLRDAVMTKEQRSKLEIMLNDTCPPYCPYRKAHYEYISQYNLQGGLGRIDPISPWKCQHPEYKTSFYHNLNNPATVTVEQMRFYHSLGFSHFKVVGREYNPVQLAEIYTYYMVKPEYQSEVMSWAIYRFSNVK